MKLLQALIILAVAHCFGQNPSIAISNETVAEGETAHFTVTLSEPTAQDMSIDLIVSLGYNFNDFHLITPTIFIPAGQTTATFLVNTVDDSLGEATEYGEFCPYVSPETSYNCGNLTILDNDPNIVGPVIAQADNLTYPVGIAVPFYNVLSNDTINGIPATVDSVILTTLSIPPGLLLTERGQINLQGTESPGIYIIEYQLCAVSDPNNCVIGTVTITLFDPLEVADFSFDDLKIFPNPVKNTLSIRNSAPINNMAISNLLGQEIMTQNINNISAEIDVTPLEKGIYFIKVTSESREKTIKIIKE